MNKACLIIPIVLASCARFEAYYPSDGKTVVDARGAPHYPNRKALIMHGSDSLGNTVVDISRNGMRFASAGGIDTSTSTAAGYRTLRHAVAAAAWAAGAVGVANVAAGAYSANQAAVSSSNVAASKASAATAASKSAETIRLAEIAAAKEAAAAAVPAAGSTIQSTIPATVVPVP